MSSKKTRNRNKPANHFKMRIIKRGNSLVIGGQQYFRAGKIGTIVRG